MIATSVPGPVTEAAGAETWASTLATATAIPARRPVHAAASADSVPAASPSRAIVRLIFLSTIRSKRGSSAAKNAASGNPSSADHRAL